MNIICFPSTRLRIIWYLGPRLLQGLFLYVVKKVICYLWKYYNALNIMLKSVLLLSLFFSLVGVSYHMPAKISLDGSELYI